MADGDQDYYEILGVNRNATKPDMDRAYLAQKTAGKLQSGALWELERAYVTLSDSNLKRQYDAGEAKRDHKKARSAARKPSEPSGPSPSPSRSGRLARFRTGTALAIGCLVLAAAVLVQVWPAVAWRVIRFDPGTRLVLKIGGASLGEVLAYDERHTFPGDIVAAAYLIRLANSDTERWLPKHDINKLAIAARSK